MRILMLSWEYPPYVVGGLGKHTAELIPALAGLPEIELHLVTPRLGGGEAVEQIGGSTVHRVTAHQEGDDIYAVARKTNRDLEAYARRLWEETGPFDLVHAHDWLVAFAGIGMKQQYRVPLLSTMHATERGRGRGHLGSELSRRIHEVEWSLSYESWRVIACSHYMAAEVADYFQCPRDKIDVIPNGVDTGRFDRLEGLDLGRFRLQFAAPDERILFSVGRMVHEKGMHVLIKSMPMILVEHPEATAVIAGKGPELDALRLLARTLGVTDKVHVVGFVSDDDRDRLFKVADCAVFPSLYEPFGIVALEAMAARCPVVVAEVGGLVDVIKHAETGITVHPDSPESLAWGIVHTLRFPEWSAARVTNAYNVAREEFNWDRIARLTAAGYDRIVGERSKTDW